MNNYNPKLSIKSWSEDDQPREKLMLKGRTSLTNAELIAILIGSGNQEDSAVELSRKILANFDNKFHAIAKCSVNDLTKFKGIGEAKAISIIAALEIGRRRKFESKEDKPIITCSKDAYNLLDPLLADKPVEEFWIVLLNQKNKVVSTNLISSGGVSGTVADVRVIMKLAVESLASGLILSHNHPSGSIKPSEADKRLTSKIKQAAEILNVKVLDHIIIGDGEYYSFADDNILS